MACANLSATHRLNVVQVTCSVEKACEDIQGELTKECESQLLSSFSNMPAKPQVCFADKK